MKILTTWCCFIGLQCNVMGSSGLPPKATYHAAGAVLEIILRRL